MKVTISVTGKFHAFHLARQLGQRGLLAQIITGYPNFKLRDTGVDSRKIVSFPLLQLMVHGFGRLGVSPPRDLLWSLMNSFDSKAARTLRSARTASDAVVVWPDCAQRTILAARELGSTVILEAGSSHILNRQELLSVEYERFGVRYSPMDPRVIQSQLSEYELADYFAVPSNFVRRSFEQRGIAPSRIIQVPYGVDLTRFHPVSREDPMFRIAYCGAVSLRKGLPYLLEAFRRASLPKTELWLVGSVLPEMRKIVSTYSGDRIRFFGRRANHSLPWFYSQCDVFCLPSLEEGMAMVIAEAMSCGLPAICTFNTGADALIREGREGFFIPIRDVAAIQEKLEYFYRNRDVCKEMGLAARRRVVTGFMWDDYGRKIISQYEQMYGSRNSMAYGN